MPARSIWKRKYPASRRCLQVSPASLRLLNLRSFLMRWLKHLFTRRRRYTELSETIRDHLEEKIADLMEDGMTRQAAERSARLDFGNVTLLEERSREIWQWPRLESIGTDIQFAFRQLWKSPGSSITTILTLSLGIAATVAIFGFVDSALIRPLPYPNPSRLMGVFETSPLSGQQLGCSCPYS